LEWFLETRILGSKSDSQNVAFQQTKNTHPLGRGQTSATTPRSQTQKATRTQINTCKAVTNVL